MEHAGRLAWTDADTILLDMDGTVLDLAFDNYFWRELLPRCVARRRGIDSARARALLFERFDGVLGTLDWYCLDYWSRELGLDLPALKTAASQRIRFLPGAPAFLVTARRHGKRLFLVTNAHRETLRIKRAVVGLDRFFDGWVSSHEFGCAKEQAPFWPALQERLSFDPRRTWFVDDSPPVLDAAADFGIGNVVGVRRPDSRGPARDTGAHAAVDGVGDLLPVSD